METLKNYTVVPEGNFDNCEDHEWLSADKIADIVEEFKQQGFNVTDEAIIHNYDAWCQDLKSEYRDDASDFFLFTPCGCNPLQFRASHLTGADYDETYVA